MAALSHREQFRGFPWTQILIIALVRVAEPIAFTSLFTYVYFMVRDFGIAKDEADVSTYAGYLSSCFALSQVISSFNWGHFADKHGRKPTILIGLSGSIFSLLLLGFSKNYWMAIAARSLMGLLNGNVGVIRTMIGEVATEKRHQSIAFAATPLAYQFGSSVGPLIGGYLVSLKETPFESLNVLIKKYPYCLPNICVSLILASSITIALLFMEETHMKHRYRHDYFVDIGDSLKRLIGIQPKARPWHEKCNDEEEPLITESSSSPLYVNYSEQGKSKADADVHTVPVDSEESSTPEPRLRDIVAPQLIAAVSSNFVMGIHAVVFGEFYPIFLSSTVIRDEFGSLVSRFPFKLVGGLGYTPEDTGKVLSLSGFFGVFFVVIVLPQLTRRFDAMQIYTSFVLLFPFLYLLVPYIVLLADNMHLARIVVYMLSTLKTLGVTMCAPQLFVTMNALSPPEHKAKINGAVISIQAFARCIGPMLWGYFMSWGQSYEIAWLGWWLCSLLALVVVPLSRRLKRTMEELN
jgi:MFS family permease